MKSRTFRLAPAVAAATAVLLLAGTAGAAVAAPSDESPSATGSATSQQQVDPEKEHWDKHSPYYSDEQSCRTAGKDGVDHGKWHEYQCKKVYNEEKYRYYWWLYTH